MTSGKLELGLPEGKAWMFDLEIFELPSKSDLCPPKTCAATRDALLADRYGSRVLYARQINPIIEERGHGLTQ